MFAAKLFTILAVLLAITQVDARKRKHHRRHHHKKEKIVDAVTRHCATGQATFVVDGMSAKFGKDHLKDCPTDITLTFALGPEDIRSRRLIKLVKYAAANGHILAYRFNPDYDKKFQETSPAKLVEKLESAKAVFNDQYEYELNYVYVPAAKHHLTKHVTAIEEAGFTVFGNSVWVDKEFRKTSRSSVKSNIKKLGKKDLGTIVYLNAHNDNLHKDLDIVYGYLHDHKFDIVNLDECFEGLQKEEEGEGEAANDTTPVAQNATKTPENPSGASAYGFSAVIAAAVAFVAVLL